MFPFCHLNVIMCAIVYALSLKTTISLTKLTSTIRSLTMKSNKSWTSMCTSHLATRSTLRRVANEFLFWSGRLYRGRALRSMTNSDTVFSKLVFQTHIYSIKYSTLTPGFLFSQHYSMFVHIFSKLIICSSLTKHFLCLKSCI